jgi:hypothetical protein
MRPFCLSAITLVLMVSVSLTSQQQKNKPAQPQQAATADRRSTKDSPIVVTVLPTPKTQDETDREAEDRKNKTTNDRNLVDLTGVLAAIGFLQLLVFGYQAYKLGQTVESAGEQSEAMERHIAEASRSATAMEKIVTTIEAGNQAVMRAYLTVIIGSPIYQERRPGQSDLKFEGRPHLVNTGNTQARKVRIRINAEIVANPIPKNFNYPLPPFDGEVGFTTVGAHQSAIMGGIVSGFVPDVEVAAIKEGAGKCLCVWGLVTYEDIFGDEHLTKFGQQITWLPNGNTFGYYITGQNDAN